MSKRGVTGAGNYNAICPVCGWKFKASELKKRWDGLWVCAVDWEPRHPMDFYRTIPDQHSLPFVLPDMEDVPSSTQFYLNFNGNTATQCIAYKTNNELDFKQPARPFPITIEFWCFNHDVSTAGNRTITRWGQHLAIRTDAAFHMVYFLWDSTLPNRWQFTSAYVAPVDTWTKYEFTCLDGASNATLTIYDLNNNVLSSESLVAVQVATNNVGILYSIGHNGTSEVWNGGIEELRLWSDIRTPTELNTYRFTELSGGEDNLLAYFKFNGKNPEYVSDDKIQSVYKWGQGWQINSNVTFVNETFMRP